MEYIDEYRNSLLVKNITFEIEQLLKDYSQPIYIMEVCGTHTVTFFRSGLKGLLPSQLHLLSGPGCPICVSPVSFIDKAIAYSRMKDVIIASFGDMLRVPGSESSLEREKAFGAQVKIVYSSLEALELAKSNSKKKIIFLGIGFETTIPTLAIAIKIAKAESIRNFFLLCGQKLIPPAMQALLEQGSHIQGFICPGHVSTIIGKYPYEKIASYYEVPCVITGFEPLDLAEGIYMLIRQIINKSSYVEIQYKRVVKEEGNIQAQEIIQEVFEENTSLWRGLGEIPKSGLKLRKEFEDFDAEKNIPVRVPPPKENDLCLCSEILRGLKSPQDCSLFKISCSPDSPIGPCMISIEGACNSYYKYAL